MGYILARLAERSTWAGLGLLLGLPIDDQLAGGLAVVLLPEKLGRRG
jgi:hypothetical protein